MTKLAIAVASSCASLRWQNKKVTWGALVADLTTTERTAETLRRYMSLSKERQGKIKDVGGFVGGYLKDGYRRKANVLSRSVVCLDVDETNDFKAWEAFKLLEVTGVMYTTHKHTPEKPRYRIVVPLSRDVDPDEYVCTARVLASWLGIDEFDDTTYDLNRMMHYPSTSKDGEFKSESLDADDWLDPDECLDSLTDWHDVTTWPVSSRVKDVLRGAGEHLDDPTIKPGFIGAFCRAYGIGEAIEQFIPDVYEPAAGHGDRYTFLAGSTPAGLVVYNNLLAYSHHNTDPAGSKTVNAFDLVRLHKFSDLDAKARDTDDVTKLPSFKAMTAFAADLKPVKLEALNARREKDADDYDEVDNSKRVAKARRAGTSDAWEGGLELEKSGVAKNTINNVALILANDEQLKGRFGFNEFEQRETATSPLPWDKEKYTKYPRPLADSDDAELRLYLEKSYGLTSKAQITDGLTINVRSNNYHPIRDYLDGLTWDNVERLDEMFINIFGADDTPYTRAITRKSFTAAVARIYRPGIKYDYVLVLVGGQGIGKSTTLSKMGGAWFSDSLTTLVGKEALESIQGSWLIELGELASLRKAEVDAVKHFVSKTEDRFRVAYGKRVEHFPRRCVFFGTTNEEDFLRDATGNRRFWVLNVMNCRPFVNFMEYLDDEIIAQLWAEAKFRFEAGEALYLDDRRIEETARDIQSKHMERDDRAGLIFEYLERLLPDGWDNMNIYNRRDWLQDKDNVGRHLRKTVCLLEIWAECLEREANAITRRDSFEIARILKSAVEWKPYNGSLRFAFYGCQKAYIRI